MCFEAGAEVVHADDGVDDGHDDEQNGDDGEGGERLSNGEVRRSAAGLVDTEELEDEVGETAKVEDNNADHARLVLPLGEESSSNQNGNRDRNGGNRKSEFGIGLDSDDDDKLNDETQEEEEIELEQGNVNLELMLVESGRGSHIGSLLIY